MPGPDRQMKVLHVAESVKGGCGTYLNQLATHQMADPAFMDIRVIVPDAHIVQVPDIPRDKLALFDGELRSLRSFYALWKSIRAELHGFRPDIIHLHSTFSGMIGRAGLALTGARAPIIYCAHGWAFDMERSAAKNRAISLAERTLAANCEKIIAISEYERGRGIDIGISPEKITTVLNGIAVRPAAPDPSPHMPRRILFIGRMDRQKGIDILMEALDRGATPFELRVIGSSVNRDQEVAGLDRPQVTRLGWCGETEINEQLAWCDVVVVPSRWEGFGLVAVEAMRAGRAVVAARVGGLPEVVADGETGLLVPPEDPAALAAAMDSLTDDRLVDMGRAGRSRFMEKFSVDRMAAKLVGIYRAALPA